MNNLFKDDNGMTYQPTRPSALARRRQEQRAHNIKTTAAAIAAVPMLWALVWLVYFATI